MADLSVTLGTGSTSSSTGSTSGSSTGSTGTTSTTPTSSTTTTDTTDMSVCRRCATELILGHTTVLANPSQIDAAIGAIDKLAHYLNDGTKP